MTTDQQVQPIAQANRSLGMLSEQLCEEIAGQADALDRGERDARPVLSALAGEGLLDLGAPATTTVSWKRWPRSSRASRNGA